MGKKYIPKNEFRYNKQTKHMNYVFGSNGKKNKSLGLTTEQTTFGRKNMPLQKNARFGATEKSYIRNGVITEKCGFYSHKAQSYEFSKEDYPNVKSKIRNYKKNNKKYW